MTKAEMKKHTCCFTGHRKIPPEEVPVVTQRLRNVLMESIKNGYRYFGSGGALGFDVLTARTVLELKQECPHIRLILVLPCRNQTRGWNKADIAEYKRIKSKADKVVYTSEQYYTGCMQKRNRHLVDNSSLCICYLKEQTGGTAYTVHYAEKCGLKIINIAK
ncbi:MAG: SLOG family protein [Clostridia bacterium]|nr:SLOG family protein [Clostridia bacterium]